MNHQMKATVQHFRQVLFVALYKVVRAFQSVDEIQKCGHSKESYRAVCSCVAVYCATQGSKAFDSVDEILTCDHSNESY